MTNLEALLILSHLPRVGPVRVRRMLAAFGSAEIILEQDAESLKRVDGIGRDLAQTIANWEARVNLEAILDDISTRGFSLLTSESPNWPALLSQIPDPPLLLYVWGEVLPVDRHAIAVVGSRATTYYGKTHTRKFSQQLAGAGYTIISGLARGIDTEAHKGAIDAGGRTIAVLGSGLSRLYPPENEKLAARIADGNGAVVSEFPLHTSPDKQTFPQRNRIVAGWCTSILVTECPRRSGALITARQAAEAGKQVFAIPGPIDRPSSAGCHELIRVGATLVTQPSQLLDEQEQLPFAETQGEISEATPQLHELSPQEEHVLNFLDSTERSIDELMEGAGLPVHELSVILLGLEMKGLAQASAGQNYTKI